MVVGIVIGIAVSTAVRIVILGLAVFGTADWPSVSASIFPSVLSSVLCTVGTAVDVVVIVADFRRGCHHRFCRH